MLYMVNPGCIDINPWTSRISSPIEPDYIIIDLDPSDNDFKKSISVAEATRQILDEAALKTFVKTSGKTGIHIYIPCRGFSFPAARSIAENICQQIHTSYQKLPQQLSLFPPPATNCTLIPTKTTMQIQ